MIDHLVLIKFTEETPKDHQLKVQSALLELKDQIPQIVRITCGENFSDRGQGFTLGLSVTFANKEDLGTYQVHSAHQKVVKELIAPYKADAIACDYEF